MKSLLPLAIGAVSVCVAACQPNAAELDPPPSAPDQIEDAAHLQGAAETPRLTLGPLPTFFDCVRESNGLLIASHRAGPAPGYPENALETLKYATAQGLIIHEIDVAESRDGVLFLMHDRSLGRTTTGEGAVADTDWTTIQSLNLKDNAGKITAFTPPKLSDVLLWAKQSGAIVELDRKPTTSFRNIISQVRAAGAEDHVVLITYNDNQAIEVAQLAPDLMMTAGIDSRAHQEALEAEGVNFDHV
ncbi:MAG: glycerophosphodiester phosphodiesterase family protein, partial [Pseudomonadota bacterium]